MSVHRKCIMCGSHKVNGPGRYWIYVDVSFNLKLIKGNDYIRLNDGDAFCSAECFMHKMKVIAYSDINSGDVEKFLKS
jgi:hypothetical protein